ncbi:hypothetical protein [Peribacillus loiseleuriae]|uniref:Uncharacterized protein n=1 Tax=Peribacillus loiseleuriae TaxID=1679170 RepID=A0A0K9GZ82_9BACI|nr:hypothetical protein [Peribacillus loiseleuriae]KMY51910.1 hypothetical protein AC625_22250 [Peribacillus loiseleuriae]
MYNEKIKKEKCANTSPYNLYRQGGGCQVNLFTLRTTLFACDGVGWFSCFLKSFSERKKSDNQPPSQYSVAIPFYQILIRLFSSIHLKIQKENDRRDFSSQSCCIKPIKCKYIVGQGACPLVLTR